MRRASLFLAGAAGLLALALVARGGSPPHAGPLRSGADGASEARMEWGRALHSSRVLEAGAVCLDVGYLCAEIERHDTLRILRWPDETGSLRVHVPPPAHLDAATARALQSHAALGIRAWHEAPFPVRLVPLPGEADVVVEWVEALTDQRLGEVRTEWREERGRVSFRVARFTLATSNPGGAARTLTPREVELTAMHEMGHALGLPHSDRPSDVMYPEKTAEYLSARDYRTVRALYRMPNGALIR